MGGRQDSGGKRWLFTLHSDQSFLNTPELRGSRIGTRPVWGEKQKSKQKTPSENIYTRFLKRRFVRYGHNLKFEKFKCLDVCCSWQANQLARQNKLTKCQKNKHFYIYFLALCAAHYIRNLQILAIFYMTPLSISECDNEINQLELRLIQHGHCNSLIGYQADITDPCTDLDSIG